MTVKATPRPLEASFLGAGKGKARLGDNSGSETRYGLLVTAPTVNRGCRGLSRRVGRHVPLFFGTLMATVFSPDPPSLQLHRAGGLSWFMAKPEPEAGPRLRAPEQILGPEHAGTAGEWGH